MKRLFGWLILAAFAGVVPLAPASLITYTDATTHAYQNHLFADGHVEGRADVDLLSTTLNTENYSLWTQYHGAKFYWDKPR